MRMLYIDAELAPNLATVWSIWNQTIGINQLLETSRVLCFSAKWHDDPAPLFYSEYEHGRKVMLDRLHSLLDEAEIITHYNGQKFDVPVFNREFLLEGYNPPSPYKQIDLLKVVKKHFRFVSNKLDHVSYELGLGRKISHMGHELWLRCMGINCTEEEKDAAWELMEKYNIQDVLLLEKLYARLLPWITNHPNLNMYTNRKEMRCPNCNSTHLHKRGKHRTNVGLYQRYQCQSCGTWSKGRTTLVEQDERPNIITQIR